MTESPTTPALARRVAAAAPAALAAALLLPACYDPLEPLASAPATVWLLLFTCAGATATAAALVRGSPAAARWRFGATFALALVASAQASLSLSEPLLVRGGLRFALAACAATAAPALAAWAIVSARRLAPAILAVSIVAGNLAGSALAGGPLKPDELLRGAMVAAPGWGASSLASLQRRALLRPWTLDGYAARLERLDRAISVVDPQDVFAAPLDAWEDDSHLVRGWLLVKLAAAPDLPKSVAQTALRTAARERIKYAEDPRANPEPFTAKGILYRDALRLTEDLPASDALRVRIATAWGALELDSTRADDPPGEEKAIAVLRALFDQNHLDRTNPLYLETISAEARRIVEAGDAPRFLALFDGLSAQDWPEPLKRKFAEEAARVRANDDFQFAPVMLFLRAKSAADRDEDARPFVKELLEKWPKSRIAPEATKLLR